MASAGARIRRLGLGQPWWVWATAALVLAMSTCHYATTKRTNSKVPQFTIGVDGRYHWAYLTSIVLDRDLDFTNQYANPESGNYYGYGKTPTGRYANAFTIGPAIAWMPFFLVSHGVAKLTEPDMKGGTTWTHQGITLYSSILYAMAAAALAYAIARRRYGPFACLCGAVAAYAAGPVLNYVLNQPYYAHAPSAFAVALLLFLWDRGRAREGGGAAGEARTLRGWIWLGLAIGFATLIRTQNLIFALPVVVEGVQVLVRAGRRLREQEEGARRAALRAAAAPLAGAVVALVAFLPQMIAWKVIYGHWLGVPQGPDYMRWGAPLWADTLFSSRNGLFPYAPLWALGMVGLVPAARRDRNLVLALLGTFALTAYLNGASSDWSGGGAYGGRRYDGLFVHVTLGLAALVSALLAAAEKKPRVVAGAVAAVALLAGTRCNVNMTHMFLRGRLPVSSSKDMLGVYEQAVMKDARSFYGEWGNPLSWPAAWMFSLRTGAPPGRYDEVVGSFFLTDFDVEQYRKPTNKPSDRLWFGKRGHAKFLLGGWGPPDKEDGKPRPARARAEAMVPINHAGPVRMTLVGTATVDTTVRVRWNDREVASLEVAAGAPIKLPFELPAASVRRGINMLELRHDGVAAGAEAARYDGLDMLELPRDAAKN